MVAVEFVTDAVAVIYPGELCIEVMDVTVLSPESAVSIVVSWTVTVTVTVMAPWTDVVVDVASSPPP